MWGYEIACKWFQAILITASRPVKNEPFAVGNLSVFKNQIRGSTFLGRTRYCSHVKFRPHFGRVHTQLTVNDLGTVFTIHTLGAFTLSLRSMICVQYSHSHFGSTHTQLSTYSTHIHTSGALIAYSQWYGYITHHPHFGRFHTQLTVNDLGN